MANGWVVSSATTFFVPAVIALFRQSVLVALTLFNAALFSTLYHAHSESKFETLDVIWASVAMLFTMMVLVVLIRRHGLFSWHVLSPLTLGSAAVVLYMTEGSLTKNMRPDDYDTFHSLWHVMATLAVSLLVWHPMKLKDMDLTVREVVTGK